MLKKISKLSLVNILAQVISIIGFSINSQLYGAEIIGGLLVVLSYSSIMSIISSGYFEQAFFVEKNENMYKYIFLLIIYLSILVSTLTGFFFFITGVSYVSYIILNIISDCLLKTITSYNISKNKIMFISMAKLLFAPVIPLLYYFSYQFFGPSEQSIIGISSLGNFTFSILITFVTLKVLKVRIIFRDFSKFKLFTLLFRRYFKFVKFSMTGEFMRTFAFRAPTIVLEKFFGKEIASFYGVANRILLMPIMIFVGTVSQIFIQKISSYKKVNHLMFSFTKKMLMILIVATLTGILIYFGFGKQLIVLLLGEEFLPVYKVILVLLPYAFSIVVYNPLYSIFSVFEKQENLFHMKLFILILSVISFTTAAYTKDFILGLSLFSGSLLVIYTMYGFKSIKIILNHDKEIN